MINPSEVGKSGEMVRLRTLESIWIQGKLRMWGAGHILVVVVVGICLTSFCHPGR